MKILDKYILKSFLVPFFATFLIILFVLVMQALWQGFENLAGKGISLPFILKFVYYTILIFIPQALPIGVLLSSIMALGNLGENYEFAAAKSAGVSLQRLVRPLVFLTLILSGINFVFLNNIYPYAIFKQQNLYLNIKKKKPAMALVAGSFNSDIPNYQIKFEEKYGEEENLLKKVLIYDLSSRKGNQKVITAERGKIISEEGSRYMTLVLYDGYYYEEHVRTGSSIAKKKKMPASSATFDEYEFNIDISSLVDETTLEKQSLQGRPKMLNLNQLKDTIPNLKFIYDEAVKIKAKNIFANVTAKELYQYPDSLKKENINANILENFELQEKISILSSAKIKTERALSSISSRIDDFKWKRKNLNFYDTEFYNRIALSFTCLLLFFIGAPLGSIIRKGGFGMPMVLAIIIYVIYFFGNTFGKNLAEESTVTAFLGSWISAFIMIPLGVLLTNRATKDKGIFDISGFLQPIINFFKKILPKNKKEQIEKKVVVSDSDYLIKDEFLKLTDKKLIDAVKNYKSYSYSEGQREVAIQILEEREITKDELQLAGEYENLQYLEAEKANKQYSKNSIISFILYICFVSLNLFGSFLLEKYEIGIFSDSPILLYLKIPILILFLFYLIKSFINYHQLNKVLNKKLEITAIAIFFIFGIPLYIIFYFYSKSEIKNKMKSIV